MTSVCNKKIIKFSCFARFMEIRIASRVWFDITQVQQYRTDKYNCYGNRDI